MSHDDLQEEVNQLRQKLQKTQLDFENYMKSAKELEEFMEAESTKKEAEIIKLKEEFILKEKGVKQLKQELKMLQSDNAALKAQAAQIPTENAENNKHLEHLKKAEELITLKQANTQLNAQVTAKQAIISQLTDEQNNQKGQFQAKIQYLNDELAARAKKIENLQQQRARLSKQSSPSKIKTESLVRRQSEVDISHHKKQLEVLRTHFDRERETYQQKIRKLEQVHYRADKQLKDYKNKIQALLQQNERLQSRTVNVTINSLNSSPSPMLIKSSLQDEDLSMRPSYHCMLLTKPHYISPFLEIYQEKSLIKIYKSSRSGCFEKSMGCYKHKFDKIAFQQENILQPIVTRIKEYEEDTQHSVFLFGVKKSNKKYLMSKLVVNLKDFLVDKIDAAQQFQAIFLKRSQEEEKNYVLKGSDKDTVMQVIDKVIALGYKNEKPKDKLASPRKTQSKPKVRYFKLKAGDFALEIGTSSFTSLGFREKTSVTSMLNNILYSKLPNILQSSLAQKYIVLTLNPIVDLYQQCKNTLSTTFCRVLNEQNRDDFDEITRSPIRDQNLNDVAKRKLQSFQRLNQETSIKIRKLEDECGFYKARFDQLEFRLKNLLNTHSGQNTYLKKSPITLSYEKLLKFVHSVQSRNGIGLSGSQSMLKVSNIYSQKDPQSMQAL